ncbi:hypothetical protein GCM10008955_32700 [Deinococcus malanensis]|uniref:Uncharacterized protein n=2 Tax=Deinococcus malanensis TaxID=1706855 RepID=A0ABQ2EZV6_9DEIO|nr:hypothetical protein GCM10008955_32700 [Deinococcus malanensis]
MATSAESRVTPEITLKEPSPCLAILRPPQSWRVGEKITTYVALGLPRGNHALNVWAQVQIKPVPQTPGSGEYRTVRVNAPTLMISGSASR